MGKFLQKPAFQAVVAILLFLSFTILADRFTRGASLDLTEDQLFTIDQGSEVILTSLDEPITVEFYFSQKLATPYPQLLAYGKRVEDMLRALSSRSGGNLELRIIDPEPFSESEDRAVEAGLTGVPLGDGSTLYLGLNATNTLDGKASIPFFAEDREAFLEYDLMKLFVSLGNEAQKKLSIITALPMQYGPGGPQAMMSGQARPYVIYEQLSEFYDVELLDQAFEALPSDTDVLLIAQPWDMSDDQLFAVDQYVLNGGRALIFLDPHSEAMNPRAMAPSASNLGPLLSAWGVMMPEGQVVGDLSLSQRVSMGGYGPDSVKDYVFWLSITDDFLEDSDIVSGSVNSLNLASAGVLEPLDNATTLFTPLVTTSAVSSLFDASRAVGAPDPDGLLRDLTPTGATFTLGARLSGKAVTAFPEKAAAQSGPVETPSVSEGDINLFLMSDTDIFDDRFWVQVQDFLGQRMAVPLAGNGSFVLNLVDHISGTDGLLALRGRGVSQRPFTVVDALRRDAEAEYLNEEERLQEEMQATEARIAELEAGRVDDGALVSPEQEAEIAAFREQLLTTRKALREVKRGLRADIDSLGNRVTVINTIAVPTLIILIALARLYIRRRHKRV